LGRGTGLIAAKAIAGLFALTLCVAALLPGTAGAATITNVGTDDNFTDDSICSLREAVQITNLDNAAIELACTTTGPFTPGTADTISLGPGEFVLTGSSDNDSNSEGDLDVGGPGGQKTVIQGAGDDPGGTSIDANDLDRAIDVRPVVVPLGSVNDLTLNDLTIRRGLLGAGDGGAVRILDADSHLRVVRSTIRANETGPGGNGGAISFDNSETTDLPLVIEDSELIHNAAENGGAIYLDSHTPGAKARVTGTTFSENDAGALGGAVFLENTETEMDMTNSTLNDNLGVDGGGAVSLGFSGASLVGKFTTFANNTTNTAGAAGGIQTESDSASVVLTGSVLADNMAGPVSANCANTDSAAFSNNGGPYNVEDGNSCGFDPAQAGSGNATNLFSTPIALDPLQDNGGQTSTRALPAGSPALDRIPGGVGGICDTEVGFLDQRGVTRPQGTACDVGAFELIPAAAVPAATTPAPVTTIPSVTPTKKKCKKHKKRSVAQAKKKKCKKKKKRK
jgi:hypothetical protein